MGSKMVPFERALVSSYRPSIVTFPLSLRASDILPHRSIIFPYHKSSLPKISLAAPGDLWSHRLEIVETNYTGY